MRKDEEGNPCPSTLGEYRDLIFAISGRNLNNKAVMFLDAKIDASPNGRDEEVLAADSQMRFLLLPMLIE